MVLKSGSNTIKSSCIIKVKKGAFEPYEDMSVEDRKQFIKNRQKLSNKDKFNA
jgi:hypothetical protein